VLVKVVGVLVLAVLVSAVVTGVVATRLTRSVLDDQAGQLVRSHVAVVGEAYKERERQLVVTLRNIAELLTSRRLTEAGQRPELISELGRASGTLELDLLQVVDRRGLELDPPAGVGLTLANPAEVPGAFAVEPASRLAVTTRGAYVQAVAIPLTADADDQFLVGGFEFADAFAYRLRGQIGGNDDIVLVAAGRVVGTTLPSAPKRPPGFAGSRLPSSPTGVRFAGSDRLVSYVPVERVNEPARGALGVLVSDPEGPLNRSLAKTRLVTSLVLVLVAAAMGWLLFRALIRPLVRLAGTAGLIAAGAADATFEARGTDEVAMLAGALEQMRVELRTKLDLVAQQASALQDSSHRIVAAQDEERHRLARDIHDGIQQQLVVLRMRLGMLEESSGPEVRSTYDDLGRELDQVIERMREVTQGLYPSILIDRGLAAALHSYVSRLPVSTRLSCSPEPLPRVSTEVESCAYFLICEAVTNALKHSGATEIGVSARIDGDDLVVEVVDDGRGFTPGQLGRRGGLLHMEDRTRSLGGELEIGAELGRGTSVTATFPLGRGRAPAPGLGPGAPEAALSRRSAGGRTGPPPPGG
jgi:signal transduction histidine kinase